MTSGKSLFLDIGTDSIKAVEVNGSGGKMQLTNALTINGANRYLSQDGIENMAGLVDCIVSALEENDITARRVYIASSALRIDSKLELKSSDAKPSAGKESKSNTQIVSSQVYGSLTFDDKITTATVYSTGDIYTLRSLAEAFDSRGYQVVSIEDSLTTTMNLVKLTKFTYDYPGKVIVSFGNTTTYICYSKDCPVSVNEFDSKISDMILHIAESTKKTYLEINELFFKYGLIASDAAIKELVQMGLDPTVYFENVRDCCLSYLQQLKEVIDVESETQQLGRFYLIVTGGYADVPGLYDMLEHEFCDEFKILLRNAIPKVYENDFLLIQNKTGNTDIGAVYGNCTGLLLKDMFRASINLLPKYSHADVNDNLTNTLKILTKVAAAGFAVVLGLLIYSCVQYMQTPRIEGDLDTLDSRYHALENESVELEQQLAEIRKLDKTGQELVALCNKYSNSMISIISVDTTEILEGTYSSVYTSPTQAAAKAAEEQAAGTQTEANTAAAGGTDAAASTTSIYPAGAYVVRGASADSSSAANFYSYLLQNGFKDRATMSSGIQHIVLPHEKDEPEERIYVFEIVVNPASGTKGVS